MARIPHNIDVALSSRRGAPRYIGWDASGHRYTICKENGVYTAATWGSDGPHFSCSAPTLTLLGDKLARIATKKDIAQ